MKNIKRALSVLIALALIAAMLIVPVSANAEPTAEGMPIKALTFNIRYDTTSHPLMSTEVRGAHFLTVVDKYKPDSIGLCEATEDWMNYLAIELGDRGYSFVNAFRDVYGPDETPSHVNESCPVFYNSQKYTLLDSGTFWLSTTPEIAGSKSWKSGSNRVCTFAVLQDKTTNGIYAHFATHLDNVSTEAQRNSVRIIQSYINDIYAKYGDIGVILSGDFNCVAFDSTNESYRPYTYQFLTSFMDDSHSIVPAAGIGTDGSTWSGYQNPADWEAGLQGPDNTFEHPAVDTTTSPLDYFFLTKDAFDVTYYNIVDDVFTFDYNGSTWHNHPISDHYGLYIEATFNKGKAAAPDESTAVEIPAALATGNLPAEFAEKTNLIDSAFLTSGVACSSPVSYLKLNNEIAALTTSEESGKYYWEITAKYKQSMNISDVSFTTTAQNIPIGAELYVSADKSDWYKVGNAVHGQLSASTRYTWSLSQPQTVKYVKLVLFDCKPGAQIGSLDIFGTQSGERTVSLIPMTGPKAGSSEGYEKLADNDASTKFYINTSSSTNGSLIFRAAAPAAISKYTVTTGSDNESYPGRMPGNWTLYGSTDGVIWKVISDVTETGLQDKNFYTGTYLVDDPNTYSYFRMDIEPAVSKGKLQISEFTLYDAGTSEQVEENPSFALIPVSGSRPGDAEGFENLVDNDYYSKFYINTAENELLPLIYRTVEPSILKTYTFTTANDNASYAGRLPISWTVSGSTDGTNWNLLDSVTESDLEDLNFNTTAYNIDNNTAYTFYKFDFVLSEETNRMQLSEISLYENYVAPQAGGVDERYIALTPISGPKAGTAEGYEKIYDYDTSTKFYINANSSTNESLIFSADKKYVLTNYVVINATDAATYPERLPAGWTIYGSTNAERWTELSAVANPGMNAKSLAAFEYDVEDTTEGYNYFKIDITPNASSNRLQISEILLFGDEYIEEVGEIIDMSALEAIYADAIALDSSDYYADSYAPLAQALEAANALINAETKTQNDVDNAAYAIQAAMDNLFLIQPVYSAETDATEYVQGTPITFTVVTDKDIDRIALANENGKIITITSADKVVNGNMATWTVTATIGTKGARTISILAANEDEDLADSGVSVNFTVDIAVSEGKDGVAVTGVRAPITAVADEAFAITINTTTSASKVGIFDAVTGKALGKISQSYTDRNGTRKWTITTKIGTKGFRSFVVKATDASGEWCEGMAFDITVDKAEDIVVVK